MNALKIELAQWEKGKFIFFPSHISPILIELKIKF